MHEPSISETAFDCPHCGAYTTQHWHDTLVQEIRSGNKQTPFIPRPDFEKLLPTSDLDEDAKREVRARFKGILSKAVFTDATVGGYNPPVLQNVFVTQCYNCKRWALWVHDRIVYPDKMFGAVPNADLPEDVHSVVAEARRIMDGSPRGAAALLRLSVQMLCIHLGGAGRDLNNDIGALVKEGLNPIVQKSLDVVRVIGNEAVHPGTIDLNDDRDTAVRLFDLVNIICEQMITQPKQVQALYDKLPDSRRSAIEKRDKQ